MEKAKSIDNTKGRYTRLVLSIALFLTLIAVLLAYTFYTSSLIERNMARINETNRVANAAQAVIKDLFDLDNSYGEDINSPHIQRTLERLEENTAIISARLEAIKNGGVIKNNHGHTVNLIAIENSETLQHINTAQQQWMQLKPLVENYLVGANNIMVDSSDELTLAVEQAKTSSLLMNESLKLLINDVYSESERQSNAIRITQIIGVAAILVYFLIFVFFFVRRLRQADIEAVEARRETQEIMQTVSTGLFLLDKNLNIGHQHSKALADIVGTEHLAGENLADILRGRISDKDLVTTRQFIEQLYNPRVKEKLVDDLNPLRKVMLHSDSTDHVSSNRYLDFKFSRVYEGNDIARILVNVIDVSNAVRLEQRLEQERMQNDLQIEMLTTILNVNPVVISEFIQNTKVHIAKINEVLKNSGSSQFELENKLNLIYREIHSLKGESSALKLHSFTKIASEAEDKLHTMKSQDKLSGNDFLPVAVDLNELLNLSATIENLGQRIKQAIPRTPEAASALAADAKLDSRAQLAASQAGFISGSATAQTEEFDTKVKEATNTVPTNTVPVASALDLAHSAKAEQVVDEFLTFGESVAVVAAMPSVTVNQTENLSHNHNDINETHFEDQPTPADDKFHGQAKEQFNTTGAETRTEAKVDTTDQAIDINMSHDSSRPLEVAARSSNDQLVSFYQEFAHDIAKRQGKKIALDTVALETINIPKPLNTMVKEITIQLLRNAIVHGIEPPRIREESGKDEVGRIVLDLQMQNDNLVIIVQDDGQGINYDAIRQKLYNMGKFDSDKIAALTKGQLLNVLFSSGFSTKETSDEDGGRGVGLDIIKERVKECGGKLNVKSDLNKMTKFIITLPVE